MTLLKIGLLLGCYCLALSAKANISADMSTLTYFPVASSSACGTTDQPIRCGADMSHSYSTLSSGTIKQSLKEDIKSVEADALEFIAGEPMTLALEEQIQNVRENSNNELDNASDEDVVVLMIKIAQE